MIVIDKMGGGKSLHLAEERIAQVGILSPPDDHTLEQVPDYCGSPQMGSGFTGSSFHAPVPPHVPIVRTDITRLHQKGRMSLAVVEQGLRLIGPIIRKPENADRPRTEPRRPGSLFGIPPK